MDFDLFELEDDDILSSMCIVPTQETETAVNPLPFFNCSGDDSHNAQLSPDSFVRNTYIFNEKGNIDDLIELTENKFKKKYLCSPNILDHVFNQARMHIQTLWADIKGLKTVELPSFWERRRQVTLLLHLVRAKGSEFPRSKVHSGLGLLRTLLTRLGSPNNLKSVYMANSVKGNETDTPSYHFLHGFLEWQFLDLIILHEQEFIVSGEEVQEGLFCKNANFERQYLKVMNNLLFLSISLFKRLKLPDLLFTSPFPCTCIKESWLLMQFLAEKVAGSDLFWRFFNQTVDNVKNSPEKVSLTSQNIAEFTVFILKGLVRLQGYKTNGNFQGSSHHRVIANYDLLESKVESFVNANPPEEQLRVFVCNVMPIILEWWPAKVDIPMTLWEYFHKKLNSAFFIAGSAPSSLAIASSSGKGYLLKIQGLLENASPDVNHSSYTLFTIILGKTIARFVKSGQNNQMQKILGRIYSKFSVPKFLALNETGIHHLIELFLVLALSMDSEDNIVKLRDKLLSIPLEKLTPNRQACITKGHLALMILFSERSMNLTDYVKRLLEQVAEVKNETNISKLMADSLCDIYEYAELFDRGEHLLIDNWLSNYLNVCTSAEQERLLETLHNVFQKIKLNILKTNQQNEHSQILLHAFSQHILPFVKQNFLTSFSSQLPHLAADFCIVHCSGSGSYSNNDQFQKLFKFFIEANCNNKQAVPQFLLAILSSDKSGLVEQSIIIQVWLKSLVLLSSNNEDVLNLTKIVSTLSDLAIVSNLTAEELLSAKEPLCVFISSVGKKYSSSENFNQMQTVSTKFNGYLVNFEKWIADRNEKTEVSFRFYSFVAIVIFNCAQIVYTRNKTTCFFHIAMTRFILPSSLQLGKAPDQKLAQIVHKVWPVIVQGIGTTNFKSDLYMNKMLIDLIVKWTPYFKISSNPKVVAKPFVNCLTVENEPLSSLIFGKLASNFLTTQRRQLGPHACLVLTIFQEVVEANRNDAAKLVIFLRHTCLIVLEHLMMVDEVVPSRNMILDLLRKLFNSHAFNSCKELKDIFIENLKVVTVKHLSYYAFFYFELLIHITQLKSELVIEIKDFILEQMTIVEGKRGGGEDVSLRSCFQKLNNALVNVNSKK